MFKEVALILTVEDYQRLLKAISEANVELTAESVKSFKHESRDLVALHWDLLLIISDEYRLIQKFVRLFDTFDYAEIDPIDYQGRCGTLDLISHSLQMP